MHSMTVINPSKLEDKYKFSAALWVKGTKKDRLLTQIQQVKKDFHFNSII
jgi:hypothetical protein